jgi:hypothetical protein
LDACNCNYCRFWADCKFNIFNNKILFIYLSYQTIKISSSFALSVNAFEWPSSNLNLPPDLSASVFPYTCEMSSCYIISALKTKCIMWEIKVHRDGEGTWDDIILRHLSKPTFLILKTTELGLWNHISVYVSVCESPFQIMTGWIDLHEVWNVCQCTCAHLNDIRDLSKKKPNLLNRAPTSQRWWLATVELCSGDLKL